jgi:hypothetical protein
LPEASILNDRAGYARNRVYVAEEAIINHPFGEEPILPAPTGSDD